MILIGDVREKLRELADQSVNCCVTSPPYFGLRDYGTASWEGGDSSCDHSTARSRGDDIKTGDKQGTSAGSRPNTQRTCATCGAVRIDNQIGLEPTPQEFVDSLVAVFREVKRVLRDDGVMFLNLGDSYVSKYDNGGRAKQGSLNRDSFSQSQNDERKEISPNHNPDMSCPVHGQVPELSLKTRHHKPTLNVHLPTEGSCHGVVHNSFATQDSEHNPSHVDAPVPSSLQSTPNEFCLPPQVMPPQLDNSSSCQDEVDGICADAFLSSDKKACICDIVQRLDASDRRRLGSAFLDSAYPYSTITPLKPKDLVGIPWMVAFALRADGWYLRQDIIWAKPNPMPESVTDRCTKSHEYIFLLSKSPKYFFDNQAIAEPAIWATDRRAGEGRIAYDGKRQGEKGTGQEAFVSIKDTRNKRDVWTVTTKGFKGAHFATFPTALIEPCILAGSPRGGVVLDPFFGAGTTGLVAQRHGRKWIGCELNPEYAEIAQTRIESEANLFTETA